VEWTQRGESAVTCQHDWLSRSEPEQEPSFAVIFGVIIPIMPHQSSTRVHTSWSHPQSHFQVEGYSKMEIEPSCSLLKCSRPSNKVSTMKQPTFSSFFLASLPQSSPPVPTIHQPCSHDNNSSFLLGGILFSIIFQAWPPCQSFRLNMF
jgi:hypothetical protein